MAKAKKCARLCPEKMKGVTTASKNTPDGVQITMTASDKETIARAQEMALVHYNAKETLDAGCPAAVKGAQIKLTSTENGVLVDITGATPEIIKKIQEASVLEHRQTAAPAVKRAQNKKAAQAPAKYVCPMGCASADKPGKCPKCGMEMSEKK
jgi:hypothetical protein